MSIANTTDTIIIDNNIITNNIINDNDTEVDGLIIWLKYGFTKEDYDANIVYRNNCDALEQYYQDTEINDPEYEEYLLIKIEAHEDAAECKRKIKAKEDDENDWWIDESLKK